MTQRIRSLDYLRLAAVFFIVVTHSYVFLGDPETWSPVAVFFEGLNSWCTHALFLVSGFVAGVQQPTDSMARRTDRIRRLLIPYLVWVAFYTLMVAGIARLKGLPFSAPSLLDLATGPGVYFVLWFLPMLMYSTVIGWAFSSLRTAAIGAATLLVTWLALVFAFAGQEGLFYAASAQGFFFYLPYFAALYLLGKASGLADRARFTSISPRWLLLGLLVLLSVSGLLNSLTIGGDSPAIVGAVYTLVSAASAFILLVLARRFPSFGANLTFFWTSVAAYGVYLMHMPFLEVLSRAIPPTGLVWWLWVPLVSVLCFFGAAAVVALAIRVPILRPAFGLRMRRAAVPD